MHTPARVSGPFSDSSSTVTLGPRLRMRDRMLAVLVAGAVIAAGFAPAQPAFAADTSAPSTPGSVAAGYYGGIGTVLTWGRVSASDLAGYRVYRSTTKTVVPTSSTLVATTTSLTTTDASVVPGQTVHYAVSAIDKTGNESKVSSVKTVVASDTTKPSSPSGLKAIASSSGVALDWSDSTAVDLRGYIVSRATSSSGTYSQISPATLAASAFSDSTAPSGITSYYRVTAVDLSGNSSSASSTSATRPAGAPVAPQTPANFRATASTSAVSLTWSGVTGATSYLLLRSTSAAGPFTRVPGSTLTGTTYTDTAAPTGVRVYYRLSALNAVGASAEASAEVAVPADTTPPRAPSSPRVTVVPGGGVNVVWNANTEADLAGYLVDRRGSDGVYARFLPAAGVQALTTPSFSDAGVTEGKTTYFRIRAVDAAGNSSSYLSVTAVNPNVAPATPSSFTVRPNPIAGLDLAWAAPSSTDVVGYSIYRSSTSSGTYALISTVGTAAAGSPPRFTDSSAPKGVTVYYRITATDAVGNVSRTSSTVSGTSVTAPAPIPIDITTITVGADKQFTTIQAALASIPANSLKTFRLDIDPGVYRESFEIDQPNVILRGLGTGPAEVVIDAARASGSTDPDEPEDTLGTAGSAVVFVTGRGVSLQNLTVSNSFDEAANPSILSAQAVALRVEGDRFVASGVRLLGNQDTLLADTPRPTARVRQYYVDSYIEGDVDYLFGAGTAVFDRVTLRSIDRGKSNNGYITAASTDIGSKYGFLISDSKIVSSAADGTVNLGRPWHPSADPDALASVVIKNTWLPAAIDTLQPWEDMASSNSAGVKVNFRWQDARFSEFGNFGPGATVNANRPQLTASNAANATPEKYLAGSDGWNPVVPAPVAVPTTPTSLVVAADSRVVNLSWSDDLTAGVIGWSVYRADAAGAFVKIGSSSQPSYSDTSVSNGVQYRYVVTADSRTGTSSPPSAEVTVLVQAAPIVVDITVDPAGAADGVSTFTTLGAALAAAPAGTPTDSTVIALAAGRYAEYPTIQKPYTTIVGATGSASDVVITGNRAAGTPTGVVTEGVAATYGTSGSATLLISGSNIQLRDLTVENDYVEGTYSNGQAVAVRTTGDRLVFENVRLLGNQDTFYANSPNTATPARIYFHNGYIEGDVDFVFGRATVVIDDSTLKALDHGTSPNGAITAASTNTAQKFGFLINDSRVIGTAPDGSQNLGRPWQPGVAQADGTSQADLSAVAQVVVRNSWLGPVVSSSATWTDMVNSGITTSWRTARFAEYGNSGPGSTITPDRPQLSAAQAAEFTPTAYLAGADGWNPVADMAADAAPTAVAGLSATADAKQVTLGWDFGAEHDVVTYRVYRSVGADAVQADTAHLVAEVAKPGYTDRGLANGSEYHYLVVAVDRAGLASPASATVTAVPSIKPLVADVTVAADGTGDYTTVQAALAAIPAGTSATPKVVVVKPGTYREVVASAKANIIIAGSTANPRDVTITFDNANGTVKTATTCPAVTAATCGTSGSATVTLTGAGVQVRGITISNTFSKEAHPEVGNFNTQAVALRATGDRQVYENVRLLGVQDTLLADGSGNISATGSGYPRQYYVNSFIEGNVDFIFGRATAVFDRVTLHATAKNGGTLFAPSTASKSKGYLVVDSRIVSDNDPGTFALGRPWRAWGDGAFADNSRGETVIRNTWIGDGISAEKPWVDFAPNVAADGRFFEYGNTGPGATVNANRPQLSESAAAGATAQAYLAGVDGWNPVVDVVASSAPSAPFGLAAAVGSGQVGLTWQESTEADVTGYRIYRDGVLIGTTTRSAFIATGLTNGVSSEFAVTAVDAAGLESERTVPVAAVPQIKIDATVFADGSGTFPTLQSAVAAAPGTGEWVIRLMPGVYPGTTSVTKSNVSIIGGGASPADVVLTNGTATPTLTITGSSVTVSGVTVANTTGANNTPALYMTGDRVLLTGVALEGTNRTVWADVPTAGATARQLIEASTITGTNEIILGRASLVIHATTVTTKANSSLVLVPSTTANGGRGFLVIDSTIAAGAGFSDVRLGGGYSQGTTTAANAPQAIVRDSVLTGLASAQPWRDYNGFAWVNGRFAEYRNTGAGAVVNANRPQLTPSESVTATAAAWLGAPTWYPAIPDPAAPADAVDPGAVTDLLATAGDGRIVLDWTPPADADLAGYRVYRSTSAPVTIGASTLVSSLGAVSTFADTGRINNTTLHYAVVAIDTAGNRSAVATASATPLDTVAPAAPSGVSAVGGDSRVSVLWTANTETDLAGYNVYRGEVKLNAQLLTTPAFAERELANGTAYEYQVTAVDSTGLESVRSDVVVGTPTAGDATPPAQPSGVETTLGKNSITLSWRGVDDPDLANYEIVRSPVFGAPQVVAAVAGTAGSYVDTAVTVGTSYTYQVRATDASGNTSTPSAAVLATAVKVDVVVAADGTGDATTLQAVLGTPTAAGAFDATAPGTLANNADYTAQGYRTILVKPGTYIGPFVSGNRFGVNILGATADPSEVVLTAPGSAVATFAVSGKEWTFKAITLESVAALGAVGTAAQVKAGDKVVFDSVRMLGGNQAFKPDTANTSTFSRIYVTNSFIEGGADTIIGRAVTVIDRSTISVLNVPGASITDSSIAAGSRYGFLITNSSITTAGSSIYLGRPYNTTSSQVTVRDTALGAGIVTAQPWKDWSATLLWSQARFSEYANTGAGAAIPNPATRPQLADADAAEYTAQKYLGGTDGWNPTGR